MGLLVKQGETLVAPVVASHAWGDMWRGTTAKMAGVVHSSWGELLVGL